MKRTFIVSLTRLCAIGFLPVRASRAGESGDADLVIASGDRTNARIVVSPPPGRWEKKAAEDLTHHIERMTGAEIPVLRERHAIDASLNAGAPMLIVGQEAIKAQAKLGDTLGAVLKKNPYLPTDGILLKREGSRVYLASNNDPSHYYAASRRQLPRRLHRTAPEVTNALTNRAWGLSG